MICKPCRDGGRMNQTGQSIMEREDRRIMGEPGSPYGIRREITHIYNSPEEKHAECEAPTTCPCQHRTGQHVKDS